MCCRIQLNCTRADDEPLLSLCFVWVLRSACGCSLQWQGSQGTERAASNLLPASAGMQQHLKYSVTELALWACLSVGEGRHAVGTVDAALAYLAAFEAVHSM